MLTLKEYMKLNKYSENYTNNILLLHNALQKYVTTGYTQENIDRYLQVHNTHMARRAITLYFEYLKHINEPIPPINIKRLYKRRYFTLEDISFSQEEIQKIIDAAENLHDKLLIKLTYEGGLRVSEAINIKRKDIDYRNQEIRVVGKGNKPRLIVFSDKTKIMLLDYIHTRDEFNPYLFIKEINLVERQLDRFKALNIVKKLCKKALPGRPAHFHMLRHSRGRHLREQKVDSMTIKDYLGHRDVSTTQIYTQVDQQMVRKEVSKIINE